MSVNSKRITTKRWLLEHPNYARQWRQNNKEKCRSYTQKYRSSNKNKCNKAVLKWKKKNPKYYSEYNREWRKNHPDYDKRWRKNNRHKCLIYERKQGQKLQRRLRQCLSSRVAYALKKNAKIVSTITLLGCSIDFLKNYLQSKFKPEMSWNNYGKIWEIDHIKPCASFDLSKLINQKKCFHYTNLQPLFVPENRSKGAKIL